ncbi:outer membrane protein [Candidatus Liberibacter americanus]|uniref:Uncharacterized protein n=1 Tax=Candidatus Liberibacter americanus str. Sao Paulo TaxID=1261131 RepID=U6B4M1_9HYPH|nr:outer membrane beta-barrel protein [Candidatus Liberibacter americanus]AHA27840.1 hypothetical protein lam_481 [Candidatus Liberibacter americanus str. Sao Paulo]EMS36008.1 hypothetical protein G653_03845 [Candidatus Liberibacter americanus PW_SP]
MKSNKYSACLLAAAFGILPSQSLAVDVSKKPSLSKSSVSSTSDSIFSIGNRYQFDERGLWTGYSTSLNLAMQYNKVDILGSKSNNSKVYYIGLGSGYDYQMGDFVAGFNADLTAGLLQKEVSSELKTSGTEKNSKNTYTIESRSMLRAGYSFESILIYGEGGLSVSGILDKSSEAVEANGKTDVFKKLKFTDKILFAPVIGIGTQVRIDDNISVGGSYHYTTGKFELTNKGNSSADPKVDVITDDIDANLDKHRFSMNIRYHY